MAVALVRTSTLALKQETTYGTDPTLTGSNPLEFVDCTLDFSEEFLNSERIRNTKSQLEGTLGEETVTGDIVIELHGTTTNGTAPDNDALWIAAFGTSRTNVAATCSSAGNTTTQITVTSGAGYAAGDIIMSDTSAGVTGVYEVTRVVSKNTNTLSISPSLALTCSTSRTVYGGKQYVITTAELPSLWIEYFRGNITRYKYAGCKVGSLAIDMTVGQMIRPRFTIAGQKVSAITT